MTANYRLRATGREVEAHSLPALDQETGEPADVGAWPDWAQAARDDGRVTPVQLGRRWIWQVDLGSDIARVSAGTYLVRDGERLSICAAHAVESGPAA
jgi:hypothetical protein